MKIAIDAWRLNLEPGTSGAVYIDNLVESLSVDSRNEIYLILPNNMHSTYPSNVKIVSLAFNGNLKKRFRSQFIWVQKYIRREVKRLRIDLFISPYHHPIAFTRIKQIVILHDLCGLGKDYRKTNKFYWRHLLMLSLTGIYADKIIPISKFTAAEFKNRFPMYAHKLTDVLYNSIRKQATEVIGKKDEVRIDKILCFAGPGSRKGYDISINFFESLLKDSNAHLIIKTSEIYKLDALGIAQAHLPDDKFSIIGILSDEEMLSLYQNIDYLLFPSRCEGFGYPVLEAIAVGVPVICSKNTPAEEILGGIQPIANSLDIDDLISQFNNIKNLRKTILSTKLRSRASEFNLENYRKRLMEVINSYAH